MLVVSPSKPPLVPVASAGCVNTAALSVELPKQSPSAARNATGAMFTWGFFPGQPLAFLGLTGNTPPECVAPPGAHSQ